MPWQRKGGIYRFFSLLFHWRILTLSSSCSSHNLFYTILYHPLIFLPPPKRSPSPFTPFTYRPTIHPSNAPAASFFLARHAFIIYPIRGLSWSIFGEIDDSAWGGWGMRDPRSGRILRVVSVLLGDCWGGFEKKTVYRVISTLCVLLVCTSMWLCGVEGWRK